MRSTTKDLATYLTTYCLAHSDMADAEFDLTTIKSTRAAIRLNDATIVFEKARDRLIRKIPEGLTIQAVVADFLTMIHEAANDTTPDED